jgi:mRNA interferase HigB
MNLPKWEILLGDEGDRQEQPEEVLGAPRLRRRARPAAQLVREALKAKWRRLQVIKDQFASPSICSNNRVVFNVGGNKYRLVVEVQYQAGIVWVKFVGTHMQYDRIDVETVNDY